MRIEKVKIKNYKLFQDFTMLFNDDLNIIVGDNEAGKSTLLEAIGLALTSQIAGRNIQYELSPFLFNMGVVKEYIDGLQNNPATPLPQILIEVFLKEDFEGELAQYKTNLSYTNLNKLVSSLVKSCHEKQLIVTTHSTFLMNKIGIDKVIFLNDGITASMTGVDKETKQYFQKLPGYDTLRMIIARRSILVEGRSDELIVQKAYYQIHNKLPLDDGIDIITVGGLVFKRFMEIAQMLQKQIVVVTDNDGDYNAAIARYSDFSKVPNIKLCIDKDNAYPTLEPQLVKANGLAKMNKILGCNYSTEAELIKYMEAHKGDCALAVFEEGEGVNMPTYILDAIQ